MLKKRKEKKKGRKKKERRPLHFNPTREEKGRREGSERGIWIVWKTTCVSVREKDKDREKEREDRERSRVACGTTYGAWLPIVKGAAYLTDFMVVRISRGRIQNVYSRGTTCVQGVTR